MMHGYSSVVLHVLIKAVQRGIRFNVIVTEGHTGKGGQHIKQLLEQSNVPTKLISNSAVGIVMSKVDCIFVGCETVLENGGIMNKVGTFTVALCAKTFKKPFYVFSESLKFMKEFPLKPEDALKLVNNSKGAVDIEKIEVDYTPPEYITLLFTSIGIFTPSAVSDELIEFFAGN
jgi:translation initiation factor eIF-2B subunit alpha